MISVIPRKTLIVGFHFRKFGCCNPTSLKTFHYSFLFYFIYLFIIVIIIIIIIIIITIIIIIIFGV